MILIINKVVLTLVKDKKRQRQKVQIITVRNERSDIPTDCIDIDRITGKYFEQPQAIKFCKVNEMDRSLERQSKLIQKEQII